MEQNQVYKLLTSPIDQLMLLGVLSSYKTFEEFEKDLKNGYYDKVKMCLPLRTFLELLDMFKEHRKELIDMFNYKMENLVDSSLWTTI